MLLSFGVPRGNRTLIIWLTVTCSTIKLAEHYLRRDLNPHTNYSIEDFKSSASTIPPRRFRTWRDLNPQCLYGNTFQECRINHSATRPLFQSLNIYKCEGRESNPLLLIFSQMFCHWTTPTFIRIINEPYGIWTHLSAVKGQRPDQIDERSF